MTARILRESPVRLVRDEPADVNAEVALGQEAERSGRRSEARAHYERALSLLRDGDDAAMAAMLMRRIAFTYQVDSDVDAAEDCAVAAHAVSEANGDESGAGHATNILAIVEWRRGRLEEAQRLYHAARASARQCGDTRLAAMTAQNLGIMANMSGDLRAALRYYNSSLADYRALGLTTETLRALSNLGMLYKDLERWEAAQRAYAEAIEIGTLCGDLSTLISVHLNVAALWIARSDFARAAEAAMRAERLAVKLGDHHADGELARVAGVLARERMAVSESEAAFRTAIDFAGERSDLSLEAEATRELAELYRRQGRNREALQCLARAHRLFSKIRARRDVADIERRNARLESEFLELVQRWGDSIEAKDNYTLGHCERVADLACALAVRAGVPREAMFWFRIGAVLHDVGKLVVSSEILNKPGPLTAAEWDVIRTHPGAGVALLSDVEFPGDVVPIVRSHHEHWDGSGYPDASAGEDIPLAARIVCIADVYDALTSERSYMPAYTHLEAIEIMRRDSGRRFDPTLFARFEDLMRETGAPERLVTCRTSPARGVGAVPAVDETDDLTGVLTRRSFVELIAASFESYTPSSSAALLVIDVDLFKRVNDAFGHLRGDDVLRGVADVLRAHSEGRGYVGRFAGDEFVVWLSHADAEDAAAFAEVVRDAVQRRRIPGESGTPSISVTVSVGIAAAPADGTSFEQLFAAADRAMYDAKRLGRNRIGAMVHRTTHDEPALSTERFVGRGRELEQLAMLLDQSLRRRPQILLLSGDAGVGKTTLLRQVASDVRLRGGMFVSGQCFESDLRPPYSPWTEALGALAALENVGRGEWNELPRLVPSLGKPAAEAPPSKYALYEEVSELLRAASAAQPLTLVLEDMQWADSAAWDLLEHVQSRLTNERLLLCITVQDDPSRALAATRRMQLSRDDRVREMQLAPLSPAELRMWLEAVLDRRDLPPELVELMQARTEGNPLLVNQLLRAMLDAHALWHDGTRWQWRTPLDVALPERSFDLFARHIARLSPMSRRILSYAAVIGRRFDVDLLIEAGGWSEDDVLEAIDNAIESGVIAAVDESEAREFAFRHALLRESLRRTLNGRREQRVHERVAETLERRNPTAVARLAEHFDRAGDRERAFTYALSAGEAAADVHATDDAIAFFEAAVRHAAVVDDKFRAFRAAIRIAERTAAYERCDAFCSRAITEIGPRLGAADELWLSVQRARVQFHTGATPADTLRSCAELEQRAVRLNRVDERVGLAILRSLAHGRCGEFALAEQAAASAVELARGATEPGMRVTALLRHGTMILERDADGALVVFRGALALAQRLGDAHAEARCRVALGVACARSQRDDAAREAYASARDLAQRIRAPEVAGLAALNLGVLQLHAGAYAEARQQFASAVELFTLVRNEAHRLAALYNAATVERECGNADAAAALYGRARDLATRLGHRDVALGAEAGAGLAALCRGRAAAADVAAESLRRQMESEGDRWFQGREMIDALLIRTALESGEPAEATSRFRRALSLAERHDQYCAAWLVAEVVTELAAHGYTDAWAAAERFAPIVAKLGYASLSARYIALEDLVQREPVRMAERR
ncbi:MAG TPA: diguanylate cyclase [Gemmatimonadaceae bacterium]|jgi:diguanylate cyclase (GGDEF)-like protein/putative nucleotidyltransferase with HDIG domain|nr:diguanylate cyclase [Gemmatimonadaceae bacterium]